MASLDTDKLDRTSNDIVEYAVRRMGEDAKDDKEAIAVLTAAAIKILAMTAGFFPLRERDALMDLVIDTIRDEARKLGGSLGGRARYEE